MATTPRPPVLPGVFDEPTPAESRQERNNAMMSVAQHAEETRLSFQTLAEQFVLNYLDLNGPTSGEILTIAAKRAGIVPHDDRAFGPVYAHLSRIQQIYRCGTCARSLRGHAAPGASIWELWRGAKTTVPKLPALPPQEG